MNSLVRAIRYVYGLSGDSRAGEGEPGPAGWIHWLAPLGLAAGALLAGLTAVSWGRLALRDGGLWVAVGPVLLAWWLGPGAGRWLWGGRTAAGLRLGRRAAPPTAEGRAGWPEGSLVALAMLSAGLVQYVAVASLPTTVSAFDRVHRLIAAVVFPRALYGAIVLMGLWGNASVMLSACLGRPAGDADSATRQLLAEARWKKLVWGLVPGGVLFTVFLYGWRRSWSGDWVSTLALAAAHAMSAGVILFGVMMLYGWLLARRGEGHTRSTLLSAAVLGEVAFLIVFHALVK